MYRTIKNIKIKEVKKLSEKYEQTVDNIAGNIMIKTKPAIIRELLNECNPKNEDLRELFGKIEKSLDN